MMQTHLRRQSTPLYIWWSNLVALERVSIPVGNIIQPSHMSTFEDGMVLFSHPQKPSSCEVNTQFNEVQKALRCILHCPPGKVWSLFLSLERFPTGKYFLLLYFFSQCCRAADHENWVLQPGVARHPWRLCASTERGGRPEKCTPVYTLSSFPGSNITERGSLRPGNIS